MVLPFSFKVVKWARASMPLAKPLIIQTSSLTKSLTILLVTSNPKCEGFLVPITRLFF